MHLALETGGFHAKGAWLKETERAYAAVKVNGNFPGNPERYALPTVQGVIVLSDAETGAPLAVMDSIEVTLRRTAAASALAAKYLARSEARTLAICGCGAQAWSHLEALADTSPLTRVMAWDRDCAKAEAFAAQARGSGFEASATAALQDATRHGDIIVTCTTSTAPFLTSAEVAPGAFIAAVGADAAHKSEIDPALMASASVFVDVLDQCVVMGDLRQAIEAGTMTANDVRADLAQLASGAHPGRAHAEEIIVFDSTGTAIEDVASAALIYERACAQGVGATFSIAD